MNPQPEQTPGYWNGREHTDPAAVEVLQALRTYQSAEAAVRQRARQALGMSEKDAVALRLLLEAERAGQPLGPGELARKLGISSASTTTLLDRLTKSGHIARRPHPTDRRALVLVPTPEHGARLHAFLESAYQRMIDVAAGLTPDQAATVTGFFSAMTEALEAIDAPPTTGPTHP
ncbi:MarR family winged helix-turn-helix transcriptional regulator [Kocuria sp. U4B]